MPATRRLQFIVPGLLGPVPDPQTLAALAPDCRALARLLARAQTLHDGLPGGEAAVCAAFGLAGPPWPVAAAARAGEADEAAVGARWWLRADPVHMRIDTSRARLFAGYALDLQAQEARQLIEALNVHFEADGLHFEAPAPDRWYLGLDAAPGIDTYAPTEVVGRNVDAFMPSGKDARIWRSRINEAQMLMHDAPINAERQRAGALPANSVWLWGGGQAPLPREAPAEVLADDPLTRGLARLAVDGSEPRRSSLPTNAASWEPRPGTSLAVEWGLRDPLLHGDPEAWIERLQRLETDWLVPLIERLRAGEYDELLIDPADGRRFRVTRRALGRFWRRVRPWTEWLGEEM
ncbi:MAG: hypothetical protein WD382_03800 [Halofilum sp. (in: g-proteobacteria)]